MNLPATLVVRESRAEYPARLLDLGLGGARLGMAEIMPIGTSVAIALSPPQLWDPLEVEGEVVWTRESSHQVEVGVRFQNPTGATLRALAELLEAVLFG